jgi:hypothetical protein
MREADLQDLLDAWRGFAAFHGLAAERPVTAKFLFEMMNKFPDGKGGMHERKKPV